MEHINRQFFDDKRIISSLLMDHGLLRDPDNQERLTHEIKIHILGQFFAGLTERYRSILSLRPLDDHCFRDERLTLALPGWTGALSDDRAKAVMVIGPIPIVSKDYLEVSYGFHGDAQGWLHLERPNANPVFQYVAHLLAEIYDTPAELILDHVYFTHIFPVGTKFLKDIRSRRDGLVKDMMTPWSHIRAAYARDHLSKEISAVKPRLILVLGREAFFEVKKALGINDPLDHLKVGSLDGKQERIRKATYHRISIVGIPHVGSRRQRTFWRRNIAEIGKAVAHQLSLDQYWTPFY